MANHGQIAIGRELGSALELAHEVEVLSEQYVKLLSLGVEPILLGDVERAIHWSRALLKAGLLVTAIRPPTVPPGGARLRVTLSAAHGPAQVDALLEVLGEIAREEAR